MTTLEKQNAYFEKQIDKILTKLSAEIKKLIKFDTVGGAVLDNNDNLRRAVVIKKQIENALRDMGYFSLVQKSLDDNGVVFEQRLAEVTKLLNVDKLANIGKGTLRSLNKVYYDKLSGVADKFIAGIQDKIYNNVLLGQQYSTLIDDTLKAAESFKNEALTQMRTIKQNFIQQTEDELAEQIGFGEEEDDIWAYVGAPLQDNSHKECIWALTEKLHTPYFTNAEKDMFLSGSTGTFSFDPVRWNCQHVFNMTDLTYEEYEEA